MEFKLSQPLQVMNKDAGEYQSEDMIVVNFVGKKGLYAITKLQDIIFQTIKSAGSNRNDDNTVGNDLDASVPDANDMINMLSMTGDSLEILQGVIDQLPYFATIGNGKLLPALLDEMTLEDMTGLYEEVLRHFLLPNIIRRVTSMTT